MRTCNNVYNVFRICLLIHNLVSRILSYPLRIGWLMHCITVNRFSLLFINCWGAKCLANCFSINSFMNRSRFGRHFLNYPNFLAFIVKLSYLVKKLSANGSRGHEGLQGLLIHAQQCFDSPTTCSALGDKK